MDMTRTLNDLLLGKPEDERRLYIRGSGFARLFCRVDYNFFKHVLTICQANLEVDWTCPAIVNIHCEFY